MNTQLKVEAYLIVVFNTIFYLKNLGMMCLYYLQAYIIAM